ncbi:MAG: efflux RND transporter periplasmic adaptor subunit [Bacteroidetes bacterium]|nr:MAG: efflux RND transporter periplasmic adaptor subunit [Bacteroidota bacterium]
MSNNIFVRFILFSCFIFLLGSCGEKKDAIEENIYYICSMDPQVMERQMGLCPICKMELAKVILTKEDIESVAIKMNETQIKLANIKVDTAKFQTIHKEKYFTGVVAIDQNKIKQVSSRVAGRIEHLYIKTTGEVVQAGQALYDLYSEELASVQREYLLSVKNNDLYAKNKPEYVTIVNSSKNKLFLLGMNEGQMEQLLSEGIVQTSFPVISAVSGVVTEINIKEGDYMDEGTVCFELSDLSSLWVEAQLYPDEMKYFRSQNEVELIISCISDEKLIGKLSFLNPEFQQDRKVSLVRMEINNSNRLYKPGMMAYVIVKAGKEKVLSVPSDAIIQGGKGSVVWIRNKDGKFEYKRVTTGIHGEGFTEIISGINEEENVVISGTYLLNSEFIFKKGMDPIAYTQRKKNEK